MTDVRLAITSLASHAEARKLAHTLVEEKLAACVNILPAAESVYRWRGAVETSHEWILLIKTTEERLAAVKARIAELHSYELPEFLVIAADNGDAAYLAWLTESVRG
jgi:periplasmic divalent cation tolerance protein